MRSTLVPLARSLQFAALLWMPFAVLACGGSGGAGLGALPESEDAPALPEPTATGTDAATIAQTPPYGTEFTPYRQDSGVLVNPGDEPLVFGPYDVTVPGAVSLRAIFEEIRLGEGSTMHVRSPLSGEVQHLTAEEATRWANTTGVLAGDTLEIHLTLAPESSASYVLYGVFEGGVPRDLHPSQCGGLDDRIASTDPRSGRLNNDCTMWLEGTNNCAFSAGHCFSGMANPQAFPHIVEFNVPVSNPDGSLNAAAIRDQYPIAPGTLNFVDNPLNQADRPDDWAVARLGPNGLGETAVSRQGPGFNVAALSIGGGEVIAAPPQGIGVSSSDLGESFTVSVNGALQSIGIYPLGGPKAGTLVLFQGSGYGGVLLSTQPILTLGTGALETFTLPAPVAVAPGVYTFRVILGGGTLLDGCGCDIYAGGHLFGGGGGAILPWDISFLVTIGDNVRVTGYGTDTGAANQTQQTHAGPFISAAGSVLSYQVDTEGGNSGAPVIEESTGNAVGIHTNAGCGDDGSGGITGSNSGTEITYGPLQAAYALVCPKAAPVVNGPGDQVLECNGNGTATASLDFPVSDPDLESVFVEFRVDGVVQGNAVVAGAGVATFTFAYPLGGPYVVVATATNASGTQASWSLQVTAQDTTPPIITCPADVVFECNGTNVVTYPDPVVSDGCGVPNVVCVPASGSVFPLGATVVTCTATDASGNAANCQFTVTVQDTTPPALTMNVARTMLWLPLNGLADIGLSVTATDACDPDVDTTVTVFSDEDHGAAPLAPDALVLGAAPTQRIQLRAQRDAIVNNGRWYLVVVDAVDDAGNRSRAHRVVVVPYNLTTAQILAIRALGNAAAALVPSPFASPAPAAGPAAPPGSFTLLATPFN